jgi:hypothetical protein
MVLHSCENLVPLIDVTLSDLIVVDDIRMLPTGQEALDAFYRITDAPTPQSAVTSKSNLAGQIRAFATLRDSASMRETHRSPPAAPPSRVPAVMI